MKHAALALLLLFIVPVFLQAQSSDKKSACDNNMTFCWYGDEVEAWGSKWLSADGKDVIQAGLAFRCFKNVGICIRARATEFPKDSKHIINNIEISKVTHWDNQQITAQSENYDWEPCDRDSYIINRVDKSVMLISSPGPRAETSACTNILGKPRTVTYRLNQ